MILVAINKSYIATYVDKKSWFA